MTPFRMLQVSIVVALLFGSTWIVRILGVAETPVGSSATWLSSTAAFAGVLPQSDNGNGNANANGNTNTNTNTNSNGNTNANANTNSGDNSDNSDNSNDNGYDDNENYDDFDFTLPPYPSEPTKPPEPECAQPGQDVTFTSDDEKVRVRVFPNTPQPLRIEIYQVIDFLSAPLPPGNLVGLLAYEIRASNCNGNALTMLPAEVNLGIRYNDIEATGLDESRFVIGRLDIPSGVWSPVEKRANDPSTNYVSATIQQTGFYMVWETR